MNLSELIIIENSENHKTILYSHDDGFTRHKVVIKNQNYDCYINESVCFKRRTHEDMAKLVGLNLNQMR